MSKIKTMDFKRSEFNLLQSRIENQSRKFIQVIYGPRQVGKTTLVQQFLDETDLPFHYASADTVIAADAAWISQQWEAARLKAGGNPNGKAVLVIDEVQKIDDWSEWVKKEWDRDSAKGRSIHVILLGSSRLLLQQGLSESLAGRYEATYMGHWTFKEMSQAFGISHEQYVWYGGYPGAAGLMGEEKRWKQYLRDSLIEATVSKDILMMTRVDKPALMKQLFELGCQYSGQILSYNKMLGQLHDAGNTTTLSHYLDLLDMAGLLAGLSKFSPNKIRRRASSPKFQVHNTAFMSAQHPEPSETVRNQPSVWGRWVESAVGAHLLNYSLSDEFDLTYWRQGNDEVDFVLQKGEQVIGIEVKSGTGRPGSGMKTFTQQFEPYKVLLVGEDGLPWQEFLEINPMVLFDE